MNNLLVMNSNSTAVTAGNAVTLGYAIHGYGKAIRLNGNQISIYLPGYYHIDVSASVEVTGTTAITLQLYENGVAIPGALATATPSAAGAVVNVSFPWIYRKTGCACNPSNLTLVSDAAGTVGDVIVSVGEML